MGVRFRLSNRTWVSILKQSNPVTVPISHQRAAKFKFITLVPLPMEINSTLPVIVASHLNSFLDKAKLSRAGTKVSLNCAEVNVPSLPVVLTMHMVAEDSLVLFPQTPLLSSMSNFLAGNNFQLI